MGCGPAVDDDGLTRDRSCLVARVGPFGLGPTVGVKRIEGWVDGLDLFWRQLIEMM
jgi:hypothetical protein